MENTSLTTLYDLFLKCERISIDSRKDCKNTFFVAIRGENFNGNKFAQQAIDSGAKYAVVDDQEIAKKQERIFYVKDTIVFLQQLAKYHREKFSVPVIGITGTNGKTTTKELIQAVLSKKYNVLATKGNLNNHIGVPLTLLKLTDKHEIAVIEMGASRVGEIKELCDIAQPTHGIITNIGIAHMEGFKTQGAIIETKRALYDSVAQRNGTVFVNGQRSILNSILPIGINKKTYNAWEKIWENFHIPVEEHGEVTAEGQKCVTDTFKLNKRQKEQLDIALITAYEKGGEVNGFVYEYTPNIVFQFIPSPIQIDDNGTINNLNIIRQPTKLIGDYNIDNCLAAITIGTFFEVPIHQIRNAIAGYNPSNNRSQIVQTKTNTLFVDCYNANPSSMERALISFNTTFKQNNELVGERYVILGDMLEIGQKTKQAHQDILDIVKQYNIKGITVGKIFRSITSPNIEHQFETTEELIEFLKEKPIQNKWILLKGSRVIKLERLIDYL